jgi:hypothetical protein
MKRIFLFSIILLFQIEAIGQDLEKLKGFSLKSFLKTGIDLSGSLSANHTTYNAWGIDNRRTPFNYIYRGNLNMTILGKIKVPITFSFSNQRANLTNPFNRGPFIAQPFNRLSLKPTYKGSKLHLGMCSMNFSQNTLAGHRFQGIGYEYNSKDFPIYGSLMLGTLLQPVKIDTAFKFPNNKPAYKRVGLGGKIGYHKEQNFIEMIVFSAKDKSKSLPYLLDNLNIFPESNLALSVNGQTVIDKKWIIKAEVAKTQIFSENDKLNPRPSFFQKTKSVLSGKNSKMAIKTGIDYKTENQTIGFEYSRIDPKYKTFGAYFFNNDLETYAIKASKQFSENKLSLNGNIGLQKDNLDKSKPQTLSRWVWAFDGAYMPSEKLNFTLNYSTFSNYSSFLNSYQYLTVLDPFQQLDTLNYRQVNNTIGGSFMIQLPNSTKLKKSISGNVMYQSGEDQQGSQKLKNSLSNISLMYGLADEERKTAISFGMNFIKNNSPQIKDFMFGPVISANKGIMKGKGQINASLSQTSSKTSLEGASKSDRKNIVIANVGMQAAIGKNHKLNFSTLFLNSKNPLNKLKIGENFTELTFNLGYTYQFKLIGEKPKK